MTAPVRVVVGWRPPDLDLLEALRPDVDIVLAEPSDVAAHLADADAAYVTRLDADLLEAAPRLRWIQAATGGVERFLIPELVESPVTLTSLKECFDVAGAEHALAVIMMWNRRLHTDVRTGPTDPWSFELPRESSGQRLGIVGFGTIGRALAARASALGMVVAATARTPRPTPPHVDRWYDSHQMGELLATSDFIVVTTPLTSATTGLVDRAFLAAMQPHAVLVDVSGRPAVYDVDAVVAALRSGSIGGAALQLPRPEPDSALWQVPHLVICLHRIVTREEQRRTTEFFIDNVRRFAAGRPLRGVVDKIAGY